MPGPEFNPSQHNSYDWYKTNPNNHLIPCPGRRGENPTALRLTMAFLGEVEVIDDDNSSPYLTTTHYADTGHPDIYISAELPAIEMSRVA